MDEVIGVVRSAKLQRGESGPDGRVPRAEGSDPADELYHTQDMDFRKVLALCRDQGTFTVPACVTILYLHQQRFRSIRGLEAYTACKVLHLESNCLTAVGGISHMSELRVLYLQSNAIQSLGDGLLGCTELDTLNISSNPMGSLGGVPGTLRTLNAARIGLSASTAIAELAASCPNLQVADFQGNALDGEDVMSAFGGLQRLRVLYLQGNPLTNLPNYRRRLVLSLPELCYLDDRPVEDVERAGAEAWHTGGVEAERAARKAFRDAKRDKERRNVMSFALDRAVRRAMRESSGTGGAELFERNSALEPRFVATVEAVDDLSCQVLQQPPAPGSSDCAVCSDGFCPGDKTSTLRCGHHFHSSCIRPWLLSFSDSCPLCRQPIGGGRHATTLCGAAGLTSLPGLTPAMAQRLSRPASSLRPERSERPSQRGEDAASIAPPWITMPGSFTATDYVRSCVALRRYGDDESVGGRDSEPRSEGDCEQQRRIRDQINEMCRKTVGTKSKQAEAKLTAWNMMMWDRGRGQADPDKSPTISGETCADVEHTFRAMERDQSIRPTGREPSSTVSNCQETPVLLGVGADGSPSSCAKLAAEANSPDAPLEASLSTKEDDQEEAAIDPTKGHEAELTQVPPGSTSSSQDYEIWRERRRVERMVRFFALQQEDLLIRASAPAARAAEPSVAAGAPGILDVEAAALDSSPEEGEEIEIGNQEHTDGDPLDCSAAADSRLTLPAGGAVACDSGDLWDLGGTSITVTEMPYM